MIVMTAAWRKTRILGSPSDTLALMRDLCQNGSLSVSGEGRMIALISVSPAAACLIRDFDGAFLSPEWRDALLYSAPSGQALFRHRHSFPRESSFAGPCFSPGSALGPSHHGIRRMRWLNLWGVLTALPQPVQAHPRAHLIHRPAKDVFLPPSGGIRVISLSVPG
jgi:hypothetical protein